MLAACPRNIYVLCCDVVDVLQVVFVDKIVDFELAMFANEGIISNNTPKDQKQGKYQHLSSECKQMRNDASLTMFIVFN